MLVQAGLGGLTVEKSLAEELVAAHLGLAMVLIGLLLWISVRARAELAGGRARARRRGRARALPGPGPRPEALRRGRGGAAAVRDRRRRLRRRDRGGGRRRQPSATSTAPTSPAASSSPTASTAGRCPFGESRLSDIHLTHRVFVYGATARDPAPARRRARAAASRSRLLALGGRRCSSVQLLLGALNVWLGEHAVLIVAHLITATLLWSTVVLIAFTARLGAGAGGAPAALGARRASAAAGA